MKMNWTATQRDAVADMLGQKLSASQIAAHFRGVSRNAIIGLVRRDDRLREIGFARSPGKPPKPGSSIAIAPKRTRNIRGSSSSRNRLKLVDAKPVPAPVTLGAPHTVGIPLPMFNGHRCKWCINDPEKGANAHLFCGETTNGGPYCAWHAAKSVGSGTESERTADRVLRAA